MNRIMFCSLSLSLSFPMVGRYGAHDGKRKAGALPPYRNGIGAGVIPPGTEKESERRGKSV